MKVKSLDERAETRTEIVQPSPNRSAQASPPEIVQSSSGGGPRGSNLCGSWTGNGEVKERWL